MKWQNLCPVSQFIIVLYGGPHKKSHKFWGWLAKQLKAVTLYMYVCVSIISLCYPSQAALPWQSWDWGDPVSFQIHLSSFVWLSSAMVLVLERAGVVTAAAVQRMRGLPEPVGLGTGRQHMFMASFLPPLPYLSVSLVSSVFPLSL